MSLRILKSLIQLVILLITFECITPVFASLEAHSTTDFSFSSKKTGSSLFNTIAFEKAEEEKTEEERDKLMLVELVDFTRIATLLAEVHTPTLENIPVKDRFNSQPALFKLHRVFLL